MSESTPGALQRAYDGLIELVASGAVKPGERLREGTLVEALGVSRTPIREALRRLAAEGMVEMNPNRGALLIGFSTEDLESLSDLRLQMEPYGVRLAVPRLTPDDIEELRALVDEMNALALIPDLDRIGDLNDRFHQKFLNCSGNRLLAGAMVNIIRPSIVRRTFHGYSPRQLARSMAHHTEILEAAEAGNPDWAESVMRSHILAGRSTVLGIADL